MTKKKEKEAWEQTLKLQLRFYTCESAYTQKLFEIKNGDKKEWFKQWQKRFIEHLGISMKVFEGKDVLEVGCGPRGPIHIIPGNGKRVGIDPLLDEYRKHGILFQGEKVELYNQRGEKINFPKEAFDFVLCFNVLNHVQNVDDTLREVHRILRQGGSSFYGFILFSHSLGILSLGYFKE